MTQRIVSNYDEKEKKRNRKEKEYW